MSDNDFGETDIPTYPPPAVVGTPKEVPAHNAFLGSHRQEVAKLIETQLSDTIQKLVGQRKYDTKVTCTQGTEPMQLNVNITTNDPRVIAILASSGSNLQ